MFGQHGATTDCSAARAKALVPEAKRRGLEASPTVGIVLDVDGLVHRCGTGVSFFVGSDGRRVLHGRADVVETLQQNFLARRRDCQFERKAVFVAMVWFGE